MKAMMLTGIRQMEMREIPDPERVHSTDVDAAATNAYARAVDAYMEMIVMRNAATRLSQDGFCSG